jgi:LuxR family transcriptional regulator, maltose regulon positive regulatory protein
VTPRGDAQAARRGLVGAQRLRPLLTHALAYLAVQARIGLARVHLALGDQLSLLPAHLTFGEIAEQMFLSRHTIKSDAMSIYRKLGVSSRSQAVSRSVEVGLVAG